MYQVGDYIVKSANGICEVKGIVNPDFVDDDKSYIMNYSHYPIKRHYFMFQQAETMAVCVL